MALKGSLHTHTCLVHLQNGASSTSYAWKRYGRQWRKLHRKATAHAHSLLVALARVPNGPLSWSLTPPPDRTPATPSGKDPISGLQGCMQHATAGAANACARPLTAYSCGGKVMCPPCVGDLWEGGHARALPCTLYACIPVGGLPRLSPFPQHNLSVCTFPAVPLVLIRGRWSPSNVYGGRGWLDFALRPCCTSVALRSVCLVLSPGRAPGG